MKLNAFDYYQKLEDTQVILIYSGPIWAVSVEELGETISRRLELDRLSVSAAHSIFSVFVEQMNNISLYSAERETFEKTEEDTEENTEVARGVFILGSADDHYFLQSGNVINDHSRELIQSRIDHLNSLDKQALRKFYREQLNGDNTNPESKGAGLGFTEIAKRASSKIEYDFTPMSDGLTFFTMRVEIGGGK